MLEFKLQLVCHEKKNIKHEFQRTNHTLCASPIRSRSCYNGFLNGTRKMLATVPLTRAPWMTVLGFCILANPILGKA